MADRPRPTMKLECSAAPSLHFKSMSAHEELSRPFELEIEAVSADPDIGADKLLGTPAAVSIEVAAGAQRHWHGLVAAFGIDGALGRYHRYRIVVRPALWLLTRSADLRIFQGKSVPDIVKQILAKYPGAAAYELSGPHAARGYCVQYRESDFDFVSRLLEEEGIFYFFRHGRDKHQLVFADSPDVLAAAPRAERLPYVGQVGATQQRGGIGSWQMQHEIRTGRVTLADYDFEKPATSLRTDAVSSGRGHEHADFEVYDYPGGYIDKAEGKAIAERRLEALSAGFTRYAGLASHPDMTTGCRFKLHNHPRADQNTDYLVLRTDIRAELAAYESGVGEDTKYECRFVAQRLADPVRPPRRTPKPTVAGPQTALVVGSGAAGDVHTDKYGRIKVQFHWDREGKKDAGSSCWLRVASGWAGGGFGMLVLPRIGQEVVVDFLEGDPDQPLVVGSVYNAANMPPYELPANKTVMSLKSRSFKGGAADYNELRLDDAQGSEYLMLRAQKDRLDTVANDFKTDVGRDLECSVARHGAHSIGENLTLTVGKNGSVAFGEMLHLDVGKSLLLATGQNLGLGVGQDASTDAGRNWGVNAGQNIDQKAGMNFSGEAGTNLSLKGGVNVVIEAGVQLTIKAGGSSVVLGPDGVSITGVMVKVNSGGAAGSGSAANAKKPTKPDKAKKPPKLEDPLAGKHR
ncbi:MAG: type VI secretion system tip protein TssI/VgrG [Rubrivivax sp.]